MNAPLGLSKVDGCEVYHITTLLYEIEKEYDTTEHCDRKYDNGYKIRIENAAENIRKGLNHNLDFTYPSRYQCLYVCKKEYVRYWYNYIQKRRGVALRVYKIKLMGTLLWTYADWLRQNEYSDYWHAKENDNFQEHEGLFEGKYKFLSEHRIDEFPDM